MIEECTGETFSRFAEIQKNSECSSSLDMVSKYQSSMITLLRLQSLKAKQLKKTNDIMKTEAKERWALTTTYWGVLIASLGISELVAPFVHAPAQILIAKKSDKKQKSIRQDYTHSIKNWLTPETPRNLPSQPSLFQRACIKVKSMRQGKTLKTPPESDFQSEPLDKNIAHLRFDLAKVGKSIQEALDDAGEEWSKKMTSSREFPPKGSAKEASKCYLIWISTIFGNPEGLAQMLQHEN